MVSGIVKRLSDAATHVRDAWRYGQRSPQGRTFIRHPGLDAFRIYVADALTPAKLKSLLRSTDSGDLATTLALFEEMESKDAHLFGVASTRRGALTGLEWEIGSAAKDQDDGDDRRMADEAADFIDQSFANLDCLDEALEHMATAIGPNVAVLELVWDRSELVDIVPVPSHRLRVDTQSPGVVRVVTRDSAIGVVASAPKFVVHVPHARAGFPFAITICHAQAMVYLIKLLAIADWGAFCETFGQPVRWANYPSNISADERQTLLDMLKNMGSSAYGAFSEGVNLQLVESSQRGTAPFEAMIQWCARQQSIAWLGQTLTTDTSGGTGTLAAASTHNDVRRDLLEDDVRREARTIRRQIIAPMIAFKFPHRCGFGDGSHGLPVFSRNFREEVDRKIEAEVIEAAQRAGVRVPLDWAHDRLAIPKPSPNEEVLMPSLDAFGEGLTEAIDAGV